MPKTESVSGTGMSDNGFGRNGDEPHPEYEGGVPTRLGIWLAVGALSMMFGALAVLYLVRLSEKANYPFQLPATLWVSTVVIALSSVTCHLALQAIRAGRQAPFRNYMTATVVLGFLFLGSQAFAWMQMFGAGFTDRNNPFSNLFYIITAVHGAHLLIGLVWIAYVRWVASQPVFTEKRHVAVDLSTVYWHFMDASWIVFFVILKLP